MTPLHHLARTAGLQIDWEDATGVARRVSDEALRKVLTALGLPSGSGAEIARSRERLSEAESDTVFVSADAFECSGHSAARASAYAGEAC